MEFQNDFDVKAPLEQVWDTMLDVERVAPCVPGAQVLERTGDDSYKVGIKVKVGPVQMQYRGEVEIVEKDDSSHSAVMSARAREARGQGTANANVRMHLSGNGDTTHGSMITEVQLSGRAAAMGQGVIKDVSAKIVDQFAENLATMLGGGAAAEEPAAAEQSADGGKAAEAEAPAEPAAAAAAAAAEAQTERAEPASAAQGLGGTPPTPAPQPGTSEDVFDAGALAKSVAADRLRNPKVLIGLALLLLFLLRRRR
jgi:carbon monoxide dehydrogenase subunit G